MKQRPSESEMSNLKKIFYCALLIIPPLTSRAQIPFDPQILINGISDLAKDSAYKLCIKEITVKGTRKTKDYIILREIHFKTGDSLDISQLHAELQKARQQVYNTTLFNAVQIEANANNEDQLSIKVHVKERWYVYPVPQFQLVDRNFNVWTKTFKNSLDRVNYGLKFVHYNLSGRRDQLRIYLLNGYSRNISFSYTAPYSNPSLTEGFTIGSGFTQNREIAYKTSSDNYVTFYPVDSATKARSEFVRRGWFINTGYIIRKGLFKKHIFTVGYTYLKVADSVITAKYNPNYFKDPVNAKGYIDLVYTCQYLNVDNVLYALKGTNAFYSILKRGFGFKGGLNMLSVEGGVNKYYPLGKNWYTSFQLYGKIKLPFDQAYINQRGLGYGETYLRGLEYFVVDGVSMVLLRSTLKKKLISFSVPSPIFHKVVNRIPFAIFAKTYGDLGYVYNKRSFYSYLNNRLLYTGGIGLDILTLYDINLRLEYSFNQLNQKGLFFHSQSGF